ncbi:MAG: hypothetical protein M0P69_16360 [Bacteroidales bacterium]|nr:hypothetical protein [Bacteroidales bacterium]
MPGLTNEIHVELLFFNTLLIVAEIIGEGERDDRRFTAHIGIRKNIV